MSEVKPGSMAALVEGYFETDPLAAAHGLEAMGDEAAGEILHELPITVAHAAFDQFNNLFGAQVLAHLPLEWLGQIVAEFEPEKAAGYFMHLAPELKKPFLKNFTQKQRAEIREFISFPENSAGRAMSRRYMAFSRSMKVKEAITRIRSYRKTQTPASYMYVVDRQHKLCGIMSIWDMILADGETTLESLMHTEVFSVNCFAELEAVAHEMSVRGYFAVPVVDAQNKLLGVIRADMLIEDVQEEASEDLQRMFGAGGDERVFSPMGFALKQRLPWLHVNLLTAFLAAGVVGFFEDIIAKITILAVFLPVVAGQGGNAGAQSLAVVMRGLVMREIPRSKYRALIGKESVIGLVNGIVVGIVTGLIAWFWGSNPALGMVIGLGMIVNLVVAGFAGAAIPLAMKSIGLDPAQCSNIILTTVTDVLGFAAFLGFAVLFQDLLV